MISHRTSNGGLGRRGFRLLLLLWLITTYQVMVSPTLKAAGVYHTVDEVHSILARIADEHSDICTVIDYGDSYLKSQGTGGFDMLALRVSNPMTPGPKPVFFLGANVHGYEVSTAEIALLFAEWLCDNYDRNADVTCLVDSLEIWIAPLLNPDGRAGPTWGNARGVDINRNFSFAWSFDNGSRPEDPGEAPFSEPETRAIRDLLLSLFQDYRGADDSGLADPDTPGMVIQLHSNGQQMFWPWGHTSEQPPNAADFSRIAQRFSRLDGYYQGQLYPSLFPVSGSLDDWVYGELGVVSFLREVLDANWSLDPPFSVVEHEFWSHNQQTLMEALKLTRAPYRLSAGPSIVDLRITLDSAYSCSVTARAEHPVQTNRGIAAAELYVNVPPWMEGAHPIQMTSADNHFDAGVEWVRVALSTLGLQPETRHMVYVRARDSANQWGPVSAVFLDLTPNAAPRIRWVSPATPCQIQTDTTQLFAVSAEDPEGQTLSCSWTLNGHPVVTRGEPKFEFTPLFSETGPYTVEVQVTDGSKSQHFTWSVNVSQHPRMRVYDADQYDTEVKGQWQPSSAWYPWNRWAIFSIESEATVRWPLALSKAGTYDVYAWWTYGSARSTAVPYRIEHTLGTSTILMDQQDPAAGGRWNLLGSYDFSPTRSTVTVSAENGEACADALKIVRRVSNETNPVIVSSSPRRTAIEGKRVSFAISAIGAPSMSFQWLKDGGLITNATSSSLTLLAAGLEDAGAYSVTVSNQFGVTSSAPMRLQVRRAQAETPPHWGIRSNRRQPN